MATIIMRPRDHVATPEEAPEAWSCRVAYRTDGTFEMEVKGETGLQMLTAALDALRRVDRLRAEPAFVYQLEGMADVLSSMKTQLSF